METALQTSNIVPVILAEARSWVDTPYQHQGRRKSQAVDCIGLVMGVSYNVGLIGKPDLQWIAKNFSAYSRTPEANLLREGFSNFMPEVLISNLLPGDVVLVSMDNAPRHCAIYTEKDTIIHAYAERGRCVENRFVHYWRKMSICAYRMADMDPTWVD